MVAELSNPEFREKLKAKSLWQKIVNGIMRLFGIDTSGSKRTTAYDVARENLEKILESPNEEIYEEYAEFLRDYRPRFSLSEEEEEIESQPNELQKAGLNHLSSQTADAAKIQQKSETAKKGAKNIAIKYKGVKKTKGFLTDLSVELGLDLDDRGSHYGEFLDSSGEKFSIRVANHNVNASNYKKKGNPNINNIGIVIKSRRKKNNFVPDKDVKAIEYVYFKEDIANADGDALSQIAESLFELFNTGVYVDKTGLARPNVSPKQELKDKQTPSDKNRRVLYTANNVVDPKALEEKYPSKLPNKYYHHSTNKFGKQPFDEREGKRETLKITGRLTTDKVDVLVVDNPNSSNEIPHITLATAEGVKPVESNSELQKHRDEIVPLDDTVETEFRNNLAGGRGVKLSLSEEEEEAFNRRYLLSEESFSGDKEFEAAAKEYNGTVRMTARRAEREGADYYPTPAPLALVASRLLHTDKGMDVLDIGSGEGMLHKNLKGVNVTAVEASPELAERNRNNTGANVVTGDFLEMDDGKKYPRVITNPPYGQKGAAAFRHAAKGYEALSDGGRMVAILPMGSNADRLYNDFVKDVEADGSRVTADVELPSCTFYKAGVHGSRTRMVVLDKGVTGETEHIDLSGVNTNQDLYESIYKMDVGLDGKVSGVSMPNVRYSLSEREAALRDGLVDVLRGAGIEVVTDEAEGQRVLDAYRNRVRAMGSKVNRRMSEIGQSLSGIEMTVAQRMVVDVFSGIKDNQPIEVERADGKRRIIMRQGNEQGAGTKSSVYKHYGTTRGYFDADDVLVIPDVIKKGVKTRKKRGRTNLVEYKLTDGNGVAYTVVTEFKHGREEFADFYTNRKGTSLARSTHSTEARDKDDDANSGAMLQKVDENASDVTDNSADSEALFEAAKKKFGVTHNIREAGYILPDGSMLDFSGRHQLDSGTDSSSLRGRRNVDHREVSALAWDENDNETGLETDMSDFIRRGAIRIDYNAGNINLSSAPTAAQRSVLRTLIAGNGGDVQVDFGDGWDSEHYVEYGEAKVTRVLGDIDRYFAEGVKPEGNIQYFRTENGEAYGFVLDGKIYIDPRVATSETAVHEYHHLWSEALETANPAAWERLKGELLGDEDLKGWVKSLYPEIEDENELAHEVFGHFGGRRGAERLRAEQARMERENKDGVFGLARIAAMFDRLRRALRHFWEQSRDLFAGKAEGVERLGAEDFADMALADLLHAVNPGAAEGSFAERGVSPVFYSNAERAVENIKQNKATAEQWLAMIKKNGGLKAGEDKWMGLSQWLEERKGESLTKEQVLEFIRDNSVKMEEVKYWNARHPETAPKMREYQNEINALMDGGLDADAAFDELVDRYGDDFGMAFDVGYYGELQISDADAASYYLGEAEPINSVRLDYTTEGLENKREIAFVVPGVEPYQKNDAVHFGPENRGRAVMWVRFGETTSEPYIEGLEEARRKLQDFRYEMESKYVAAGPELERRMNVEDKAKLAELKENFENLRKNYKPLRVLVIDEIQSNRHQDAREEGYRKSIVDYKKDGYRVERNSSDTGNMIFDKDGNLVDIVFDYENTQGVPAAPFEKNWHEVAMKRMLRLAAEEGFDKVAWTTGEQQAERYNLGDKVDSIEVEPYKAESPTETDGFDVDINIGNARVSMYVTKDGEITSSDGHVMDFSGKQLSDVVGKEMAEKILSSVEYTKLAGADLRIGGEGMKGFYDNILPRFMDKYGKRWGVKTGAVELSTTGGEVMHSVDVTDAMKSSVLREGQPLFQKSGKGNLFGGNRGYVGYSKSRRAVAAEEEGLRNASQMNGAFADDVNELLAERGHEPVTLREIKKLLRFIPADEWHHTSKYGNRTNYYSAATVADYFTETPKDRLDSHRVQVEKEKFNKEFESRMGGITGSLDPLLGGVEYAHYYEMRNGVPSVSIDVPYDIEKSEFERLVAEERAKAAEQSGGQGTHYSLIEFSSDPTIQENIESGLDALERLANGEDEVSDAMRRDELADLGGTAEIAFIWGSQGHLTPAGRYKGGEGFLKIIEKHGIDDAIKVVETIAKGEIGEPYGVEGGQRVDIDFRDHHTTVSLFRHGKSKSWVLTGYTIDVNTDAKGRGSDLSNATQNDPIRTRAELGAALKSAANLQRIFGLAKETAEKVDDGSPAGRHSLSDEGENFENEDYDAGVRYSVSGDGTVDEYNRAVNTQGRSVNIGGREVRPRMTRFNFQEAFQDAMLSLYCLPHLQTADFFKAKNQICSILFCVIGRKVLILRH